MFFILSKTIGLLVKPLFWLIIGLSMAVFSRKPKLKKTSIIASLFILVVFTNPLLIDVVLKKWEPAPVSVETLTSYDIGIVLGGFARHLPVSNNVELSEPGDRLWQAFSLYQQGKIKRILITGGSYGKSEAAAVYDALKAIGVPDSALLAETRSRNTHENAVFTAEMIDENHCGATCLLITSAVHIKRSLGCFRKAGLNPDTFPANHISRHDKVYWAEWLRPEPDAMRFWDRLINEWVGIVVYKIKGYL